MPAHAPPFVTPKQMAIASTQFPARWGEWTTNADALAAATTKLHSLTDWEAVLASAGLYWFPSAGNVAGSLAFMAADAGDPNNTAFTARAWIGEWDQTDPNFFEFTGYPAFDLACIVGDTSPTATSRLLHPTLAQTNWVDSITATNDGTLSPGVRHIGAPAGVADVADRIAFDFAGGAGLLLNITVGNVDAVAPRFRAF